MSDLKHPNRQRLLGPYLITLFILSLLLTSAISAQDETTVPDTLSASAQRILETISAPRPATNLVAVDVLNDGGGSIKVSWSLSPDDNKAGNVQGYRLMRAESESGPYTEVGSSVAGASEYEDGNTDDDKAYFYKIVALAKVVDASGATTEVTSESDPVGPVSSSAQWFNWRRINVLVYTSLVIFFIMYFIQQAKSGKKMFIRKIAGMEAVDEAVGRATEMGRKIFFIPGINDMDSVQTIAAMTILGRVAELAGQNDTWLEVPVCRSLVLVTAKEVVKEAYTKVGRPDSYNENQVHYITDDQFGYAAAIDGMVVREKPATIFYMGAFFAESLILAETGNAAGAIQIAGTAQPAQLPFFVTACDYTLIGEELFAASAYLSKEPKLLGSLKGQDYGKGILLAGIVIGTLLETFGIMNFSRFFSVN